MNDIHEIIARAEQIPGGAVSIDPAERPEYDPDEIGCTRCPDKWSEHFIVKLGDAGEVGVCRANMKEIRAAIIDNEWGYDEDYPDEESEADGPDPDRLRDEAWDRAQDPPERYD